MERALRNVMRRMHHIDNTCNLVYNINLPESSEYLFDFHYLQLRNRMEEMINIVHDKKVTIRHPKKDDYICDDNQYEHLYHCMNKIVRPNEKVSYTELQILLYINEVHRRTIEWCEELIEEAVSCFKKRGWWVDNEQTGHGYTYSIIRLSRRCILEEKKKHSHIGSAILSVSTKGMVLWAIVKRAIRMHFYAWYLYEHIWFQSGGVSRDIHNLHHCISVHQPSHNLYCSVVM